MEVTRLVLLRHGSPAHIAAGVAGGPKGDRGLTDRGRAETASVAARLAKAPWAKDAAVYSSTLGRSIETARPIAAALGLVESDVVEHCGLCSYHVPPELDGRPVADLWANQVPGGGVYIAHEEGNESWISLLARVGAALFEIAQANAGRTAVVVAHGEVVQASLVAFGEMPIRRQFDTAITPTSITEWTTGDDLFDTGYPDWKFARWTLVRFNDAAHLEDMEDA